MVLCHVTVQHIPGFKDFQTLVALVALREIVLGLQMRFHVVSFVGNVGLGRGAEGADELAVLRPHGVRFHKV